MAELEETLARFCEAWNRHDVEGLAALWVEDGELNHPWGFHAVGRPAILKLLAEEHRTSMAASELSIVRISTRGEENSALADIETLLSGVRAPNGRSYDLNARLSAMFVRSGDSWQIRTMTPTANAR